MTARARAAVAAVVLAAVAGFAAGCPSGKESGRSGRPGRGASTPASGPAQSPDPRGNTTEVCLNASMAIARWSEGFSKEMSDAAQLALTDPQGSRKRIVAVSSEWYPRLSAILRERAGAAVDPELKSAFTAMADALDTGRAAAKDDPDALAKVLSAPAYTQAEQRFKKACGA